MSTRSCPDTLLACSICLVLLAPAMAQSQEDSVVQSADYVLREIVHTPGGEIPYYLLEDAQGIAIVPGVVKLGFVVGVRHGRGVLLTRDEQGQWKPPLFIAVTGGSVGWQAGIQAADLILIFKTRRSIDGLMRGKLTLGADASVAAGPVGRQAAAATDTSLRSEIYSYSRSRGLFAGVALDGSAIQMDVLANTAFYRSTGMTPNGTAYAEGAALPESARRLMETVAAYTSAADPAAPAAPAGGAMAVQAGAVMPAAAEGTEALRRQLAAAARQLDFLLDERWRRFLALPAEVFIDRGMPGTPALQEALRRYETVLERDEYRPLAQRPEFQKTYDLLQRLHRAAAPAEISLPPPPTSAVAAGSFSSSVASLKMPLSVAVGLRDGRAATA